MLKTNESRRTAMGAAIVAALVIASVILYLRLGKPMIALVRDRRGCARGWTASAGRAASSMAQWCAFRS